MIAHALMMTLTWNTPQPQVAPGAKVATAAVAPRFEAAPEAPSGGSKLRNWKEGMQTASPGDFLSRLWAHFGKPAGVGFEGFTYVIRDRETGLVFEAYSGASGPAYGGDPKLAARLAPVLQAFDRLLAQTTPVECSVEYETDFGTCISGFAQGRPFDREKEAP